MTRYGSLIDVEASEAALELITIGEIVGRIDHSRRFRHREQIEVDLHAPPPSTAARFAIARVDQQAMEPRLEAIGVTQAGQASQGGHEGFLSGVLGSAVISQDESGHNVEPIDRERAPAQ